MADKPITGVPFVDRWIGERASKRSLADEEKKKDLTAELGGESLDKKLKTEEQLKNLDERAFRHTGEPFRHR